MNQLVVMTAGQEQVVQVTAVNDGDLKEDLRVPTAVASRATDCRIDVDRLELLLLSVPVSSPSHGCTIAGDPDLAMRARIEQANVARSSLSRAISSTWRQLEFASSDSVQASFSGGWRRAKPSRSPIVGALSPC